MHLHREIAGSSTVIGDLDADFQAFVEVHLELLVYLGVGGDQCRSDFAVGDGEDDFLVEAGAHPAAVGKNVAPDESGIACPFFDFFAIDRGSADDGESAFPGRCVLGSDDGEKPIFTVAVEA